MTASAPILPFSFAPAAHVASLAFQVLFFLRGACLCSFVTLSNPISCMHPSHGHHITRSTSWESWLRFSVTPIFLPFRVRIYLASSLFLHNLCSVSVFKRGVCLYSRHAFYILLEIFISFSISDPSSTGAMRSPLGLFCACYFWRSPLSS